MEYICMNMKDRYLFKAKRIDNGEWVIGFYVRVNESDFICTRQLIHGGLYTVSKSFKVDTSTICQCTGLKDKNGKLIWENDILKYEWDRTRIDFIKYQAPIFTYSKTMRWSLQQDEVIGNIFDNPELLERE